MLSGVTGFEGDTKGLDGVLTSGLTARPRGIEPCGRSPHLLPCHGVDLSVNPQGSNGILNGGHNPSPLAETGCSDSYRRKEVTVNFQISIKALFAPHSPS